MYIHYIALPLPLVYVDIVVEYTLGESAKRREPKCTCTNWALYIPVLTLVSLCNTNEPLSLLYVYQLALVSSISITIRPRLFYTCKINLCLPYMFIN